MCTVSILRNGSGFVLTANRDELRVRDECGLKQRADGVTTSIYPVDAQAKGTWVGVNDYGLAASLLNMYEADYQGSLSRGLIIPRLLEFNCLNDIRLWLTQSFEPTLYSAFVLLVMDSDNVYRYRWDGVKLTEELIEFSQCFLESSSSVDLHETLAYRQRLFHDWHQNGGDMKSIFIFHLRCDKNNTSQSVCMARELSHTKSVSQIRVNSNRVEFNYLAPDKTELAINALVEPKNMESAGFNLLLRAQRNKTPESACLA